VNKKAPKIIPFAECPYYEQEKEGDIKYQALLTKGELGNLGIGYVQMKGPAKSIYNSHTEWEQVYLVLAGSGTIILNDVEHHIEAPCIIRIPIGTKHGVKLEENEQLSYLYVNDFLN
jgi:mannose-6-phosphate isomerase-like protein (cupin superfamily)